MSSHVKRNIQKQSPEVFFKILQLKLKRDSGTSVSCEFCEIFKNAFFTEHLQATSSETHVLYC